MSVSNLIGQKLGCCHLISLIYLHQISSKTVISKLNVGLKTHYVHNSKWMLPYQDLYVGCRYLSFTSFVALNCMHLCIDFPFKHFVLYIQLYIDMCLHFHQCSIQFHSCIHFHASIQFHSCIHFIPVFSFMPYIIPVFHSTSISSLV